MKTGRYIWQHPQWPQLRWDDSALSGTLARTAETGGRLLGELGLIGLEAEALRAERVVAEALSTGGVNGTSARLLTGATRTNGPGWAAAPPSVALQADHDVRHFRALCHQAPAVGPGGSLFATQAARRQ